MPAGKEIEFIPRTLTVAQEDEIAEHTFIVGLSPGLGGYSRQVRNVTNVESYRINFSILKVGISGGTPYCELTPPVSGISSEPSTGDIPHGKSSRNRPRNHQLSRFSS